MHVLLAVCGIVGLVVGWAWLCRRFLAWRTSRVLRTRGAPEPAAGALSSGHQPPPGLGPLSPSERFLSHEAARGLRELELFLADDRMV